MHTVALGAYAVMIVHSGEEDHETSGLLMTALSFLTQVDLMVYVMIWIAFTCTLTGSGLKSSAPDLETTCNEETFSFWEFFSWLESFWEHSQRGL